MNRSTPGLPVHHQLPEFTQTHVHRVGDAIQPSHPLLSPFPPAPNSSQHQSLFQWVNSQLLAYSKGNRPWIFIGSTDAEAAIIWPPDAKKQFIGKDPDAGKYWRQEEKGRQKVRWLDCIINSMDMRLIKLWEMVKDREAWPTIVHGIAKCLTWQWVNNNTKDSQLKQQGTFIAEILSCGFGTTGWITVSFIGNPQTHVCVKNEIYQCKQY